MGLFDVFKKPAAPKPEGRIPGGVLGALIARDGLERAKPPETSALMGEWWELPPNDDLFVAYMERGEKLVVFLGEPEEITEIYLVRDAGGQLADRGQLLGAHQLRLQRYPLGDIFPDLDRLVRPPAGIEQRDASDLLQHLRAIGA